MNEYKPTIEEQAMMDAGQQAAEEELPFTDLDEKCPSCNGWGIGGGIEGISDYACEMCDGKGVVHHWQDEPDMGPKEE